MATTNIQVFPGDVDIAGNVSTLNITGPLHMGDETSNLVDLSVFRGDEIFAAMSHQSQLLHPYNRFGELGTAVSISSDGNYALVASFRDAIGAGTTNAGSAQVYIRNGTSWAWQAQLLHPNPAANYYFGYSVSISADGSYAVIASSQHYTQVYLRNGTSWSHQAQLPDPNSQAGFSVSISGDGNYAIGGTPNYNNTGAAQVYIRNGTSWTHQQQLLHPNPAAQDKFGYSVSISRDGNYALVGARQDDTGGTDAGSAQVYIRNGTSWAWQAQLLHPTPAAYDYFGCSVSISADGNYALVGVEKDDPSGTNTHDGSAQVYIRNGTSWTHQAQIFHPTPASSDGFGISVSISGDGKYALIGVPDDDTGGTNAGSAQLYERSGTSWTHLKQILHSDTSGPAQARFGLSVSISGGGTYALVGAPKDDPVTTDAGSAHVYNAPSLGVYRELVVSSGSPIGDFGGIRADGTLLSFTGQHICFPEGRMSQGLVVSANQNKYMSLNGPVTMGLDAIKSSESLPVVSLSNVVNDRSVFGVVDRFEGGGVERTQTIGIGRVSSAKEVGDNRVIVNSIGEGALWVANTNGNLVSGDYLTTSSLPGYAQKQDSDSLRNSTVAKITMDCDFSPEDLPVQIIKKKENGDNDLDPYGRFQWVDSEETQKAYKVRYLDASGSQTDQSNAAHIAAYVGCTYHCG